MQDIVLQTRMPSDQLKNGEGSIVEELLLCTMPSLLVHLVIVH